MYLKSGKEFLNKVGDDASADNSAFLSAAAEFALENCPQLRAYRDALDRVAIVAATDLRGRIADVNSLFCAISGYDRDELIGASHSILNSGHHPKAFFTNLWRTISTGSVWRGDICNRAKSGQVYWVDTTIAPLREPGGRPTGYVSVRFDISARKMTEEKLHEELRLRQTTERLLSDVIEAIPAGVVAFDELDHCLFSNSSFRNLCQPLTGETGQPNSGQRTRGTPSLLPMAGDNPDRAVLAPRMRRGDSGAVAEPHIRQIGPDRWIQIHNRYSPSGNLVSIQTDISALKSAEQLIKVQAERDALTGLANRSALRRRLDRFSQTAPGRPESGVLMLLDLDDFKLINDRFGHDGGDALLRTIAERLTDSVRRKDIVARLGGDEFAILLEGLPDRRDAHRIAQELLDTIQRPAKIGQQTVIPSGSIGVACFPRDGRTPQELYKNADLALYQAKLAGRSRHCVYNRTMRKERRRRSHLIEALRLALGRNEIQVALQPQSDARSGRHSGFEALVRWQLGTSHIPAPEIISIAEEAGLVSELGFLVIEKALGTMAALRMEGLEPGSIAFNIVSAQLLQPDFPDRLTDLVKAHRLPLSDIDIEVTENVILDRAAGDIAAVLNRLRAVGMTVSLDDFGTGYASLKHLKQFPINRLKIDRTFVEGILDKKDDEIIVRTIISLAHSLGFDVVAEGVETLPQYRELCNFGCDLVQGYLLARPMPAADVRDYLITLDRAVSPLDRLASFGSPTTEERPQQAVF